MIGFVAREMPVELFAALRRARALEAVAFASGGRAAQMRAANATGVIALAAVEAGWFHSEVADALGMQRQTVSRRVQRARALYAGHRPALLVDEPLGRAPDARDIRRLPVDEREWLTRAEAAALIGVHSFTIRNWLRAGLLPNTIAARVPHMYLRADVLRAAGAERYRTHGVSYAALGGRIAASGV